MQFLMLRFQRGSICKYTTPRRRQTRGNGEVTNPYLDPETALSTLAIAKASYVKQAKAEGASKLAIIMEGTK